MEPDYMNNKDVYDSLFKTETYNIHPPSEFRYQFGLKYINQHSELSSLLDVGSGRGSFLSLIQSNSTNINHIHSIDLDKYFNLTNIHFNSLDLLDNEQLTNFFYNNSSFDIITCLDCLEHLREESIDNVFYNFSKHSKISIFTIANHSDTSGGIELHTIQRDNSWWKSIIEKYYDILDYKEEYGGVLYLYHCKTKGL